MLQVKKRNDKQCPKPWRYCFNLYRDKREICRNWTEVPQDSEIIRQLLGLWLLD